VGTEAHIRVLPDAVVNKIAAGEVVERPASVVKELVENAIDAAATRLDIEISAGGRKLVSVQDNGHGLQKDDALLSIERHSTSKIKDVDDIEGIGTLGFRGEALAAAASVSRFRMVTRREEDVAGTEITMLGGKLTQVREAGCPVGTSVEARDIFFNVPARRKFLRSHQTETSHVRNVFIVQALAHPTISMSLKIDGHEAYNVAGTPAFEDRLRDLFGPDFIGHLKPVGRERGGLKVHGCVSAPSFSRSDRSEQYFFVNGRVTSAPLLNFALREGYRTMLPHDRFPSVFLFIELDPKLVDVNVHPTKREVRFRRPGDVRDAVIAAIREALGAPPAGGEATEGAEDTVLSMRARKATDAQLEIENLPSTRVFKYPRKPIQSFAAPSDASTQGPFEHSVPVADTRQSEDTVDGDDSRLSTLDASPWSWCRVLGQVGSLYVVIETEDGLVLMDPHAGHERVLYERFMADVMAGNIQSQTLLMPQTVEMGPKDALRVRKHLDLLAKMGFGISEFGGDAFVVDAIPSHFADLSAAPLLAAISRDLEQAGSRGAKEKWREEAVARAACRSAVKARDRLSLEEIEKLVVDLARTEMPYTCPHGRPTLIFTPFKELNRKFGRE